ncbi:MAG: NUDIX hydrolase [Micrococcales bacterium]|nr:NUDIX hydrolase [Micrococcales bacterium]
MSSASPRGLVLAAGAVCWRETDADPQILVVRRPRHRDVSLPKGKVDPGETLPETAAREIAEETGLILALGAPLGMVSYALPNGRPKQVHYWAAEVDAETETQSSFAPNEEIESLEWVAVHRARKLLTYPHDVDVVARFAALHALGRARTFAIVALRHGKAVPPAEWAGADETRPLTERGLVQAMSVAPGIAAFRPEKLISSTAVRCGSTVAPTARITGLPVSANAAISQDAFEQGTGGVPKVVAKRLRRRVSAVLCSHGPVLPQILAELGRQSATRDAAPLRAASALSPGEYAVVHLSVEQPDSGVVAVEVHGPAPTHPV